MSRVHISVPVRDSVGPSLSRLLARLRLASGFGFWFGVCWGMGTSAATVTNFQESSLHGRTSRAHVRRSPRAVPGGTRGVFLQRERGGRR